jgi:hypothetical protein
MDVVDHKNGVEWLGGEMALMAAQGLLWIVSGKQSEKVFEVFDEGKLTMGKNDSQLRS